MRELLYIEIPTADIETVCRWLQEDFEPELGEKIITPVGFRLRLKATTRRFARGSSSSRRAQAPEATISETHKNLTYELSVFVWSALQTTYLKVFCWADRPIPDERKILQRLSNELRSRFPHHYPEPPIVNLQQQSIFTALAPHYPLTVKYFQKMPNGERDLQRVYWWEQRWREGVRNPQRPRQVVFSSSPHLPHPPTPPPPYHLRFNLHWWCFRGNPRGSYGSIGLPSATDRATALWSDESGVEYFPIGVTKFD